MDKLLIKGGRPLAGSVNISGAKNAALPELCAALLTEEAVTLRNVPGLQDVATMLKLIRNMGVAAERNADVPGDVVVNAGSLNSPEAPYELVKTMRASVLALGPLLARFGQARVSLPGGCAIGSRPVDQHIRGLQAMGAEITVEHGYMLARLPAGTRDQPSFSPTSFSYSLLEANVMNFAAASAFFVVLGMAQAQVHSQPDVFVLTTGANA